MLTVLSGTWEGHWALQGYNADPRAHLVRTAEATSPAWSPDGSKLMYLMNEQIWIDALDGTVADRAALAPTDLHRIRLLDCKWAPDGEHIVYTLVDYLQQYPQGLVDLQARRQ